MKWRAEAGLAAFGAALALAGCGASDEKPRETEARATERAVFLATRAVPDVPVRVGATYQAPDGERHVPGDARIYEETGFASWYGDELRGNPTANGERFNPDAITAAHRTLPMPSYIEVTALDSGRTILARVNDRGPFSDDRLVDLSHGAARQLGISGNGHARVRIRRVYPDDREKLALRAGESVTPRREGMAALQAAPLPEGAPRFVQIATFRSQERARDLAQRTGARAEAVNGLYRVRIGPFTSNKSAIQALRDLDAKGYPDARILTDTRP